MQSVVSNMNNTMKKQVRKSRGARIGWSGIMTLTIVAAYGCTYTTAPEEDDEEPPPPSKARKQLRPGKAGKATAAKSTKSRPGVMPEDVVEDFAFSDDEMG